MNNPFFLYIVRAQEALFYFLAVKGQNKFRVHVFCDSYIGCDRDQEFIVTAKPKPEQKVEEQVVLQDDDEVEEEKVIFSPTFS
jgi:hypothetical protein